MSFNKPVEVGEFTRGGWLRVESDDPKLNVYQHACVHCGQPDAKVFRAHPSAGQPYDHGSHDDPFACITHLRSRLDEIQGGEA